MKPLFIFVLLIGFAIPSYGQEVPAKFKIYKTQLEFTNGQKSFVGFIYAINDTTIFLGNSTKRKDIQNNSFELVPYTIKKTRRIKVVRKRKIVRSMGIGFTTGLITGGILGYSLSDEGDKEWAGLASGITGGFGGAIAGFVFGAIIPHRNFLIDGDLERFNLNRQELNKFALIKDN